MCEYEYVWRWIFLLLMKKGDFFWVMRGPGEENVSGIVPHPVTIKRRGLGCSATGDENGRLK